MPHPMRSALWAGLCAVALGCQPGIPDDTPPEPDCLDAVLAADGCSGCHGPGGQGGLDLTSEGRHQRLVGVEATAQSCAGRVLIDPADPQRSLLLQVVGAAPAPGGGDDPCQLRMPLGGVEASPETQACLTTWVDAIALAHQPVDVQPFEPSPVESALTKVKALINGQPPTADELRQVSADPASLRALVDGWTAGPDFDPAFERKLAGFLQVALQQKLHEQPREQFDVLRQSRTYRPLVQSILEESFVRTALDIVQRGAPFTQIATTRRFMLTTANLAFLRYVEQTAEERVAIHTYSPHAEDAALPSLADEIESRTWAVVGLERACQVQQFRVLDLMLGVAANQGCRTLQANLPQPTGRLAPEDFTDWRLVELVRGANAEGLPDITFYDVPALRAVEDRMKVGLPRVGFFSSQAFFANWKTNVDNQFRVTTNQTVLTALHATFSSGEPTPAAVDEDDPDNGIPREHVDDETCYGCHKHMDPMRLYFAQHFTVNYQAPNASAGQLLYQPTPPRGFAFLGEVEEGGNLYSLGRYLADHPRFAVAWAQKLCHYANSAPCDESDPAFTAIVDRFRQGYDLRGLIVDLLSSPLVTGLEETATWAEGGPTISITRRNHLCALLDARTGSDDICARGQVSRVIGLIPEDDFARGAAAPTQPARPSGFHFAAAEAVCEALAQVTVTGANPLFSFRDPQTALDNVVDRLMALPPEHPRRAEVLAALQGHYAEATAAGNAPREALRSAFTVACLSPDVMGMGL